MSNNRNKFRNTHPDEIDELSVLRGIRRLLEILARLNLETLKSGRSQADMIQMLDSVGCGQSEIADLLGTTPNTVNVTLYKAKKRDRRK